MTEKAIYFSLKGTVKMRDLDRRIELHKAYWEGRALAEPIASYRIGDYFFANKFKANSNLLKKGTQVTADMIHVDDYMEDYQRMYQMSEEIGQTAFFTVEPNTGIPWMEGMAGCPILGEESAFMAIPVGECVEDLVDIRLERDNPWFLKYIEFVEKLVVFADGRMPVGEPIMRGTTDVIGCLIGQSEMACAVMTDPEIMRKVFGQVAVMLKEVIAEQWKRVPEFYGGYSSGFYHLWAPGKMIWYQEDLSAVLSPWHYDEFLRETSAYICEGYDYTFTHLHPNSFFHLDGILSQKGLRAVQINKDVSGPTVEQMLPNFQKVLAADKRLIVWGDLTREEVAMLMDELPHKSLFLNVVAPALEEAKAINDIITTHWK